MDGSKKWIASLGGAIAVLCATVTAAAASGASKPLDLRRADPAPRSIDRQGTSDLRMAARILDAHNRERDRLSLRPLKWNVHLEREAREWAHHLSRKGKLQHADGKTRNRTGENLWMGTAGHWPVETMVGKQLVLTRWTIELYEFWVFAASSCSRLIGCRICKELA